MRDEKLQVAVAKYAGAKGNLQFPLAEAMPYALITRIVKAQLRENAAKGKKTESGSGQVRTCRLDKHDQRRVV